MLWWAVVKVENVVFLVFVVSKGTVFSGPAPYVKDRKGLVLDCEMWKLKTIYACKLQYYCSSQL